MVLEETSLSDVETIPVAIQCLELAIAFRDGPARLALQENLGPIATPPANAWIAVLWTGRSIIVISTLLYVRCTLAVHEKALILLLRWNRKSW